MSCTKLAMSSKSRIQVSLCQLIIRTYSKKKKKKMVWFEDLVYWKSVLLSRVATLLLNIIKVSGNLSLIRGRFRNPATFHYRCFVIKDLVVYLRSGRVPVLNSTLLQSSIHIKHFWFREIEPFLFDIQVMYWKRFKFKDLCFLENQIWADTSRKQREL